MNTHDHPHEELFNLLDVYLDGQIDDAQIKRLEAILISSEAARAIFVRYCRLETDLHLVVRAQHAGARALRFLDQQEWTTAGSGRPTGEPHRRSRKKSAFFMRVGQWAAYVALAACLVLAATLKWWPPVQQQSLPSPTATPPAIVASLVNARDCQWFSQTGPSGAMRAGEILNLHAGLAEIQFARGARAIMEGPALLELLTDNSVRLERGKLATRVSDTSRGFEVQVPLGKVVDLGTEFGVAVGEDGTSDVYVFAGRVDAFASVASADKVSVSQNQAARLDSNGLVLDTDASSDIHHFIRAIPEVPVGPQKIALDFGSVRESGIRDMNGRGIGVSDRLPGTGHALPINDPAIFLNLVATHLEVNPPECSLREGRNLEKAEFFGAKLSDYGFTGQQDFEINSRMVAVPDLGEDGQIGLYVGKDIKHLMRGGINKVDGNLYRAYVANNIDGRDLDPKVQGLVSRNANVKITLRRVTGRYSLRVENQSRGTALTLPIRTPEFLMDQKDLYIGFYTYNTQPDPGAKVTLRDLKILVWTGN